MGGIETYLTPIAVCLALGWPASPAHAEDNDTQLRTFAACAGRMSAIMEYQWMFDGTASEQTQRQRAAMLDLIAAIMPADRGREVLNWRISAKMAQSALLTRATFNDDREDAAWASRMAEQQARECTALLLS